MRNVCWLGALLVALAFVAPVKAQTRTFLPFGGVSAQEVRSEPVDTSQVAAPIAQPQTFSRTFSLLNFLPNISRFSAKPVVGQSTFPSADGMPGKSYLKHFGFSRGQPIR